MVQAASNSVILAQKKISMCNQMVTSEIREQFHACFVQILIISRAFRRGKLLGFGQKTKEKQNKTKQKQTTEKQTNKLRQG